MKKTKFLMLNIISAGALGGIPPAHAEIDVPAPPSTTQAASDAGTGIAEIVVTAQKRSENLQKTPAAVTSVSGERLRQMGITNLQVAQALIPGAHIQQDANSTDIFLRGVGSNLDFSNVQPSVATNFNGVFIPREGTSVGLYDIDRLEALPGPQGTLYGRSAIGGIVNISFKRPEFSNSVSGVVEAGNYDLAHVTLIYNVATSGTFAVRAAIDYTHRDGYLLTGSDSQNDPSGRLSALWNPNDNLSIYWWGYFSEKNGNSPNAVNKGSSPVYGANGQLAGFVYNENAYLTSNPYNDQRPGALAVTAPFGQPTASTQTYRTGATGAQIDVKLSDNITLTDIPGFFYLTQTLDHFWIGVLPVFNQQEYHQVTNELRLAGNTGPLNWLLGLYGYHTQQPGEAIVGTTDGPNGPAVPGTPFPFYASHILNNRLEGEAIFGQATYSITDSARLTAGARYGIDEDKANGISLEDQVTPYMFDNRINRFDYKLAAQYDLTSRVMAYVQYQTGYQPATFNEIPNTSTQSNLVKTATLNSIEAGFKARFFENTLQVNDEAFYSDYKNLAVQYYDAAQLYNPIFNAAKITIPGNQLDILWQPTQIDRVNISVDYIHARNKNFVTPGGNSFDGLAPAYAADWTVSAGVSHDFHVGPGYIRAATDVYSESHWWADYVHNPGTKQDSYAKLDATLTFYSGDGHWNLGLWGRNLTDRVTIVASAAGGIPGPATAFLAAPRTFGGRVGFSF
jgi:iron complex outermembrane recepter protein